MIMEGEVDERLGEIEMRMMKENAESMRLP